MPLPGGEGSVDKIVDQLTSSAARRSHRSTMNETTDASEVYRRVCRRGSVGSDRTVDARSHGYQEHKMASGYHCWTEELCRWRLWERAGGGFNG